MHSHAVEISGPVCGRKELSCARPAPSPLDVPEQSCGVCLPGCRHEAGEAAAPRPARRRQALCPRARRAPVTLAPGGSASCPVIASGKRPANGAAGRRPPFSGLAGALPVDSLDRRCPGRTRRKPASTSCGNSARKTVRSLAVSRLRPRPSEGTSRVAEIAEKEFPVSRKASCAISCRAVSGPSRAGLGAGRSLTPRTPIPRLPGLCSSGPLRSELSARSADRGRVVPVLDRFSGRSPIAPFAPSFP